MSAPDSTRSFTRLLTRARHLSGAVEWVREAGGGWEEAARLWSQVVERNPVNGEFWAALAQARDRSDDRRGAIESYERALKLGVGFPYPAESAYGIARCYALLGESEPALDWLAQALDLGYRDLDGVRSDDDLRLLREDPRFWELVGPEDPSALGRDEGWRSDIRLLAHKVRRMSHHTLRPITLDEFDAAAAALEASVPELTDHQLTVEIMKLVCLLGDGHSLAAAADEDSAFQMTLPLRFFLFEEGLYVVAAAPEHGELLGARVLRFGEHTVDEIMDGLLPVISRDNEQWPRYMAPFRMRETALLHTLGLIPDPDRAELTVETSEGQERTIGVAADASWPTAKMRLQLASPDDWLFLPRTLAAPLPLTLRNLDVNYWFIYLPEQQAVYFQFNRVLDDGAEPLAAFTERLFDFIAGHDVERLIIDVRWNNGGNTFLEMPLVHRLIGCDKLNRRGALFVIIGRQTYSACQNFVTLLDRHTQPIFVGEPTGSCPNFTGESLWAPLPYSKVRVSIADLYWQNSWPMDYRTWIAPQIYVPPTFAAFRDNRDPALEAALAAREHLPGW